MSHRDQYDHRELLGWAFTDAPTIEAYRKSTGEDVKPTFCRYRDWVEENIIGEAEIDQTKGSKLSSCGSTDQQKQYVDSLNQR